MRRSLLDHRCGGPGRRSATDGTSSSDSPGALSEYRWPSWAAWSSLIAKQESFETRAWSSASVRQIRDWSCEETLTTGDNAATATSASRRISRRGRAHGSGCGARAKAVARLKLAARRVTVTTLAPIPP